MTFQEMHRLNKYKIQTIKGLIHSHDESLIANLRQSPEERRARIEAHKHNYEESFLEALNQAQANSWDKWAEKNQVQKLTNPFKR